MAAQTSNCAERENHRFGEIEADVATVRFGRFGEICKKDIFW